MTSTEQGNKKVNIARFKYTFIHKLSILDYRYDVFLIDQRTLHEFLLLQIDHCAGLKFQINLMRAVKQG